MSWGIRITALYLGFVALILTLVFISSHQKVELESKDYYKQELAYQDKIDAIQNANNLSIPISYSVSGKSIVLTIPNDLNTNDFSGEVYLLKPSDSSKDLQLKLNPNKSGIITLNNQKITQGVYKMKITVKSGGKEYIKEEVVNFN